MKIASFLLPITLITIASCVNRPGPVERKMIGLTEKFDRWDYNGDGFLTASELAEASKISGQPTSEIITFYDLNNDSKISLKEAEAGLSRVDEAKIQVQQGS